MKRLDLPSWPVWIFLELCQEDFILHSVLSQALLCLFATFSPVADDHSGNLILLWDVSHVFESWEAAAFLLCCLLSGALEGSCVLLKRCFRFADQQGIYTLIEVFTGHVVIDDADSVCEYGNAVCLVNIVSHLGKLTLLFDDLDWLAAILPRSCFLERGCRDFCLDRCLIKDRLLPLDGAIAYICVSWVLHSFILLRNLKLLDGIEMVLVPVNWALCHQGGREKLLACMTICIMSWLITVKDSWEMT